MFGSAYRPGSTGLAITRARNVHVAVEPSGAVNVTTTGSLRSTVSPEAGDAVTPSAVSKTGASAVTSVPGTTGKTTVRAVASTIGATLSCAGSASVTPTSAEVLPDRVSTSLAL